MTVFAQGKIVTCYFDFFHPSVVMGPLHVCLLYHFYGLKAAKEAASGPSSICVQRSGPCPRGGMALERASCITVRKTRIKTWKDKWSAGPISSQRGHGVSSVIKHGTFCLFPHSEWMEVQERGMDSIGASGLTA